MREALRDPEVVYRRRWLTLLVLCISLIVITLDNTILNVAIPTLAHSTSEGGLGASASQLQWIVDAYTLVFAGLLLTAGSLGDRFGRYRFLAFGLAVFGIGSALSASASSASMLIGTRALMGIGGACIMPSTLSIITNVFTDAERARQGNRRVGGRVGARRRARTDHRRRAARALLVGLGVHGERAHRDRRPRPRLLPRARIARPNPGPARPGGRGAVDREPRLPACGRSSRRPRTAGARRSSSPASRSAACCWPASSRGRCTRPIPCSTCTSSRTRGSAPRAARSRSCSSRCTARCSCSRSTCSRCSATPRSRPVRC